MRGLVMWRGGEEEEMSRATRWAEDGLVRWRRRCGRKVFTWRGPWGRTDASKFVVRSGTLSTSFTDWSVTSLARVGLTPPD